MKGILSKTGDHWHLLNSINIKAVECCAEQTVNGIKLFGVGEISSGRKSRGRKFKGRNRKIVLKRETERKEAKSGFSW